MPPDSSTPCSIEVFRKNVPGNIKINYYVTETKPIDGAPDPDPTDIISWDQAVYVIVDIDLEDPIRRLLCGKLCVDIDIDTCGPAPDIGFDEKVVELDPCGTGHYRIEFELPAGTFTPDARYPNRCGRVYRICVTVGSEDACGEAGLIWGHCDSFELAVHRPVPAH